MPGKVAKIGTFSDWIGMFNDWRKDIGVNTRDIEDFRIWGRQQFCWQSTLLLNIGNCHCCKESYLCRVR